MIPPNAGARLFRTLASSANRGALTGAALGGASGLVAAPQEGDTRLHQAMRRAVIGGAAGGLAGAAGRASIDYRLLHPEAGIAQTAGGVARLTGKAVQNFGKRQVHGLTGAHGDAPHLIGLDSSQTAGKRLHLADLRAADKMRLAPAGEHAKIRSELVRKKQDIARIGIEGDQKLRAGLTNLPGIARGLANAPVDTGKAMWHAATGGGAEAKALALGLPTAAALPSLMRGDESAEGGPSMGHKVRALGANVAGGIATAGLPILPQVGSGLAIDIASAHRRKPVLAADGVSSPV